MAGTCERYEILLYLQAERFASPSFMFAAVRTMIAHGRRYEFLGSETKEPMPHSVVSRMSHACFPTSELHRGSSDGCCTGNGLVSTEEP